METNKAFSICCAVLILLCNSRAVDCQTEGLTAQAIVAKMGAQYAQASSYQDTGVVMEGDSKEPILNFKTHFVRPQLFRFEWTKRNAPERVYVIWNDGQQAYSYYSWRDPMVEKEQDVGFAIAGATGISNGAAHTIPSLLMPDVGGTLLTELTNLFLVEEQRFEGEDCFVVKGADRDNSPVEMWISKRDFLLRQIKQRYDDGTFTWDIRREVKLNGPIAPETFSFIPPGPPPPPSSPAATSPKRVKICGLVFLPIAVICFLAIVNRKRRTNY